MGHLTASSHPSSALIVEGLQRHARALMILGNRCA
jgi:hypothetical protein